MLEHEAIVQYALSQRGVLERPLGSNRGPELDLYRPSWKREELRAADARAGKQVAGDAWCAWFVTHCWHRGLGRHPLGQQIGGCYALALEARKLGLWVDLPNERVDLLVAAYPGCAFVQLERPLLDGPSRGHTGLVTGVSEDGWLVSTVEGNSGNAVRAGRRQLWAQKMRGLVLPLGPLVLPHGGLLSGGDLERLGTR